MNRSILSTVIFSTVIVLVLGLATFVAGAQNAGEPVVTTSAVSRFSDFTEVSGASSQLTRFPNGVTTTLNTSDLVPGDVYTVWWVIFNEPQNCSDGACNLDDLFYIEEDGSITLDEVGNRAMNLDALEASVVSIQHASGSVSVDGTLSVSASLGLNNVPGIIYGPGLQDADAAEIHLVVRTHGPAVDGAFEDQLSTFGGGCEPIDTAPCDDVQYAMHFPVNR